MFRLVALKMLLLLLLSGLGWCDEIPFTVKGTFHGKVGERTFEQPFEFRLNPDQREGVRVELQDTDLELALAPRWRYSGGSNPDGILLIMIVKCRAEGLRLQRFASALMEEGKAESVELHAKEESNLFTVDVTVTPDRPQGKAPEQGQQPPE